MLLLIITKLIFHLFKNFKSSYTVLPKEKSAKWTADSFICLIYLFEEKFGLRIVFEGLFVRMKVSGEVPVSFLDFLVSGVLIKMQYLIRITVHN